MTATIAIVSGGTARLLRPRKGKGSPVEVFANFMVPPDADDDDIARLVMALTEVLNPPEPVAPPAPAPAPEERREKRRKAIKTDAVVEAMIERQAFSEDSAVTSLVLAQALGAPHDQLVAKLASDKLRDVVGRIGSRSSGNIRAWLLHPPTGETDAGASGPTPFPPTYPPFAAQRAG